ncbi:hypothetical protein evm_013383 [Chilo suppressalis]|nr:hypothetical protein evm_013383 [Chilo suppressalis]
MLLVADDLYSVTGSPEASNVNTRRGAQNASVGSIESVPTSASPVAVTAHDFARPAVAARPSASPDKSRACTSTPQRAYAAATASQAKEKSSNPCVKRVTPAALQNQICNEEVFIKMERKKKKPTRRNLCGVAPTGPNHLLRPAIPTTPLYVSRLHYSTKEEEIVEYIRIKTKFSLRVARLESRHNVNFIHLCECQPPRNWGSTLGIPIWPVSPHCPYFHHQSTLCRAQLSIPAASSRQRFP